MTGGGKVIPFRPRGPMSVPVLLLFSLPRWAPAVISRRMDAAGLRYLDLGTPESLPSRSKGCGHCRLLDGTVKRLKALRHLRPGEPIVLRAPMGASPTALVDEILSVNHREGVQFRIEAIVTLVDGESFWQEISSDISLTERYPAFRSWPVDDVCVSEAVVEQIESSDMVLCAGFPEVGFRDRSRIAFYVHLLQPRSRLRFVNLADMDWAGLYRELAGTYDDDATFRSCRIEQLFDSTQAAFEQPQVDGDFRLGFVYRRRAPFHPERLHDLLASWPEGIARSQGTIWVADPEDVCYQLNQTGPSVVLLRREGLWLARLPDEEREAVLFQSPEIRAFWDRRHGDRYTEIAFVGRQLDVKAITERLDSCLLSELEIRQDWRRLQNPFLQAEAR